MTASAATMKGVAAGALSMFSLGFAAYTFLYGTLLKLEGNGRRIVTLRDKLRHAIYWIAITIWLAGAPTSASSSTRRLEST